jgi:predicted nucleotidyltransferase
MKDLEKALEGFSAALGNARSEGKIRGYALIGGLAVSARSTPRATKDVDFLVSAEKPFFEKEYPPVIRAMRYRCEVIKGDPADPVGEMIRVYDRDDDTGLVDIIRVHWNWQLDVIERAESVTVGGVEVPVARAEDLVVLKLKAGGTQDLVDVEELLKLVAGTDTIDKVRLLDLARRARVSKDLEKTLARLGLAL